MIFILIGSALLLLAIFFSLYLLVSAFRKSAKDGLLSMFVPFYMLYFALKKLETPNKWPALGAWVMAFAMGGFFVQFGVTQVAKAALIGLNDLGQQAHVDPVATPVLPSAATPSAATPTEVPTAAPSQIMHCDMTGFAHICHEYNIGGTNTEASARTDCQGRSSSGGTQYQLEAGECPVDNSVGKCVRNDGAGADYFYWTRRQNTGSRQDMAEASAGICFGGSWVAIEP